MPNIIPAAWVAKTQTYNPVSIPSANGYPGTGTYTGPITNVYDNNISTYTLYSMYHPGDGNTAGECTFEATWTSSLPVTSVFAYARQASYGGNYKDCKMQFTIYLRINGVWTTIYDWKPHWGDGFGSNAWGWETLNTTISTGWNNVTGARLYLFGFSYSYEGDRQQYAQFYQHEFQVDALLNPGLAYII